MNTFIEKAKTGVIGQCPEDVKVLTLNSERASGKFAGKVEDLQKFIKRYHLSDGHLLDGFNTFSISGGNWVMWDNEGKAGIIPAFILNFEKAQIVLSQISELDNVAWMFGAFALRVQMDGFSSLIHPLPGEYIAARGQCPQSLRYTLLPENWKSSLPEELQLLLGKGVQVGLTSGHEIVPVDTFSRETHGRVKMTDPLHGYSEIPRESELLTSETALHGVRKAPYRVDPNAVPDVGNYTEYVMVGAPAVELDLHGELKQNWMSFSMSFADRNGVHSCGGFIAPRLPKTIPTITLIDGRDARCNITACKESTLTRVDGFEYVIIGGALFVHDVHTDDWIADRNLNDRTNYGVVIKIPVMPSKYWDTMHPGEQCPSMVDATLYSNGLLMVGEAKQGLLPLLILPTVTAIHYSEDTMGVKWNVEANIIGSALRSRFELVLNRDHTISIICDKTGKPRTVLTDIIPVMPCIDCCLSTTCWPDVSTFQWNEPVRKQLTIPWSGKYTLNNVGHKLCQDLIVSMGVEPWAVTHGQETIYPSEVLGEHMNPLPLGPPRDAKLIWKFEDLPKLPASLLEKINQTTRYRIHNNPTCEMAVQDGVYYAQSVRDPDTAEIINKNIGLEIEIKTSYSESIAINNIEHNELYHLEGQAFIICTPSCVYLTKGLCDCAMAVAMLSSAMVAVMNKRQSSEHFINMSREKTTVLAETPCNEQQQAQINNFIERDKRCMIAPARKCRTVAQIMKAVLINRGLPKDDNTDVIKDDLDDGQWIDAPADWQGDAPVGQAEFVEIGHNQYERQLDERRTQVVLLPTDEGEAAYERRVANPTQIVRTEEVRINTVAAPATIEFGMHDLVDGELFWDLTETPHIASMTADITPSIYDSDTELDVFCQTSSWLWDMFGLLPLNVYIWKLKGNRSWEQAKHPESTIRKFCHGCEGGNVYPKNRVDFTSMRILWPWSHDVDLDTGQELDQLAISLKEMWDSLFGVTYSWPYAIGNKKLQVIALITLVSGLIPHGCEGAVSLTINVLWQRHRLINQIISSIGPEIGVIPFDKPTVFCRLSLIQRFIICCCYASHVHERAWIESCLSISPVVPQALARVLMLPDWEEVITNCITKGRGEWFASFGRFIQTKFGATYVVLDVRKNRIYYNEESMIGYAMVSYYQW